MPLKPPPPSHPLIARGPNLRLRLLLPPLLSLHLLLRPDIVLGLPVGSLLLHGLQPIRQGSDHRVELHGGEESEMMGGGGGRPVSEAGREGGRDPRKGGKEERNQILSSQTLTHVLLIGPDAGEDLPYGPLDQDPPDQPEGPAVGIERIERLGDEAVLVAVHLELGHLLDQLGALGRHGLIPPDDLLLALGLLGRRGHGRVVGDDAPTCGLFAGVEEPSASPPLLRCWVRYCSVVLTQLGWERDGG